MSESKAVIEVKTNNQTETTYEGELIWIYNVIPLVSNDVLNFLQSNRIVLDPNRSKPLGAGNFGTVWKGTMEDTNEDVAVKIIADATATEVVVEMQTLK